MDPWLVDVLTVRNRGYTTPMAPTEVLALVLAFAVAMAGMLFLLARVVFQNAWALRLPGVVRFPTPAIVREAPQWRSQGGAEIPVHSRALAISESVSAAMRRENGGAGGSETVRRIERIRSGEPAREAPTGAITVAEPLGSGYRRSTRRETGSQRSRDERG
jgi:type IV secretion system protein VirB6